LPLLLKNQFYKRILSGLLVLIVLVGLIKMASTYFSIPFYTYPGFGIKIPPAYNRLGIDVSHHQDKINWQQVADMKDLGIRVSFVFMKATQGTYLVDRQFKRNWSEAKDQNLQRGAYLFFDPRKNGAAQAKYFIKQVKLARGDFAPVIDFEELYGVSPKKARKEFMSCASVLKKYYNIQPILYTYVDFYRSNLNAKFEKFPLWVAHYKSYGKPRIDREWKIWQFSDRGKMNGIKGEVDFNVSDLSQRKLREIQVGMD